MILGILPEQGGSIANLRRTGQDVRFFDQYLRRYVQDFDEVHYFSYAQDRFCPCCEQDEALARIYLHPNYKLHAWVPILHRWLYAFLLPLIHWRAIRRCDVLRVMQATGALPAWIARLLFGVPFVVTYGYDYGEQLWCEGKWLRAWLFRVRARWALRRADGVIVTTQRLANYAGRFSKNVRVIPNSVDTERFSP